MPIRTDRRPGAIGMAFVLLLIGLLGGPPGTGARQQAPGFGERVAAAPGTQRGGADVAAVVGAVRSVEATAVRLDARGRAATPWPAGQPVGYALAAAVAGLTLALSRRSRRRSWAAGRRRVVVGGWAARGPPAGYRARRSVLSPSFG
ncbi:hypothetical protein [Candidatus Frankia nodulisporulans]|uniref:hypothetical protein n=1 Tax=Candidatus Frankia nodulisporulans TaxID=2060052 RepID=UPI0013D4623C|nr:hypothetical protein [Candidatus Frankia nodulisporulans]